MPDPTILSIDAYFSKYSYTMAHKAPRNLHTRNARRMVAVWGALTKRQAVWLSLKCVRRFGGTATVTRDGARNPIFIRGSR